MDYKKYWENYFLSTLRYETVRYPNFLGEKTWFTKEGISVGYNYPLRIPDKIYETIEDTSIWEITTGKVRVSQVLQNNSPLSYELRGIFLPDLKWVLERLHDPLSLPLLIGIEWVAPLVAVLLEDRV